MPEKPVTEKPVLCLCGHYWINHEIGTGCLLGWDAEHRGCQCTEYEIAAR